MGKGKVNKAHKKAKDSLRAQKAWVTKHESTLQSLIAAQCTTVTPGFRNKLVAA